jgi:hypothetical protein
VAATSGAIITLNAFTMEIVSLTSLQGISFLYFKTKCFFVIRSLFVDPIADTAGHSQTVGLIGNAAFVLSPDYKVRSAICN